MELQSNPVQVVVRAAAPADAEPIARLAGQLGYPSTLEQVRERLRGMAGRAEHGVFVAELRDGQLAGWIHLHETLRVESDAYVEVGGLVVAEAMRSRGIGRLLMMHAEHWTRTRGRGMVRLRSNVIRERAHAFYKQLGYRVTKTQKAFRKEI